jgi:hypothetical protein
MPKKFSSSVSHSLFRFLKCFAVFICEYLVGRPGVLNYNTPDKNVLNI